MSAFDDFLASQQANDVGAATAAAKQYAGKGTGGAREVDPRFYDPKLSFDEEGKGSVIVRLLPQIVPGKPSFVRRFRHNWKNGNKFYNQLSRKSIGQDDPVFDFNGQYFNGSEDDKKKMIPRSAEMITNVLIVEDQKRPELVGKVFLYQYGNQIGAKIEEKMFPEFADVAAADPFNLVTGMNFRIRIYKKKVGTNMLPQYDKSAFDAPSALTADQARFVFENIISLDEFIAPSAFKSYEELKKLFEMALGRSVDSKPSSGNQQASAEPREQRSSERREERSSNNDDAGSMDDDIPFNNGSTGSSAAAASEEKVFDAGDDAFFEAFK